MPKVNTVISYQFSELAPDVQEKVISEWRSQCYDFYTGDEIVDSLKATCRELTLDLKNYRFGDRGEDVTIEFPGSDEYCFRVSDFFGEDDERLLNEVTGIELRDFLLSIKFDKVKNHYYKFQKEQFEAGNKHYPEPPKNWISIFDDCPFTGTCYDEDLIKFIRAFLLFPSEYINLRDLCESIEDAAIKLYHNELNHWYSDEYIREEIECNQYEFLECGKLY